MSAHGNARTLTEMARQSNNAMLSQPPAVDPEIRPQADTGQSVIEPAAGWGVN
jgi:hypothetical protein